MPDHRNTFYKSPAVLELVGFTAVALLIWYLGSHFDVVEWFHEFTERHEAWDIDEIALSLSAFGVMGFIYAARRAIEFKREAILREKAEASIKWIAQHDALTRLPNRRFLQSWAETMGANVMVYSIDLNGFKAVNDLHGHHVGDALLIEVARRLTALLPEDLVVRLGGDEFCVISGNQAPDSGLDTGRAIIECLSRPIVVGDIQTTIGASVGIARYPAHAATLAEALMCADVAMYESKKLRGSVPVAFAAHMRQQLTSRVELEAALRLAIREGEIVPWYQPLVDLKTGTIEGFEALARWRRPSGEFTPPLTFIPMAEQSGLIVPLAESLLRQACRDAMTWPSHVRLAFNLSPVQLSDPLLGLKIISVLGETGLPAHRLELEVTESVIVNDLDVAHRTLRDLQRAGVRIAIDDFGVGYSSLAQLAELSFDKIKIDRSFVARMNDNPKQFNLVRAIISMGHGLGVMTTAEGIEGQAQLTELKSMGCTYGQGYFFGKAGPAAQALALAENGASEDARLAG